MTMQRWRGGPATMWRPFEEMERFMDEFMRGWPAWQRTPTEGMGMTWTPNIEMFDKQDNIVVRAELPGMKRDDINISVTGDTLTISGERKTESSVKGEDYYRSELSYGKFSRSITLPTMVEADKINATYENGILEITLPKSEKVKPRKIQIKSGQATVV